MKEPFYMDSRFREKKLLGQGQKYLTGFFAWQARRKTSWLLNRSIFRLYKNILTSKSDIFLSTIDHLKSLALSYPISHSLAWVVLGWSEVAKWVKCVFGIKCISWHWFLCKRIDFVLSSLSFHLLITQLKISCHIHHSIACCSNEFFQSLLIGKANDFAEQHNFWYIYYLRLTIAII